MKKFACLSILSLSLIASTAFAVTPPSSNTGIAVVNTSSSTVVAHVYDNHGLIIDSIYVPGNYTSNVEPHKTFTNQLYAGITVASASGGVDNLYTSSCFAAHVFQTLVYSTNPSNNNFNSNKPPVCTD